MTSSHASAVLDTPRAINIRAIEHELSELWKQAQAGDPDAITRVCVLNLVVGVTNSDAANHVTGIISELTDRYPNRAIVLQIASEAQPASLDAWVQAHCQVPGPDRRQVCCEQITVVAQGEVSAQAAGIVLPLLVPDVPVVLWWPQGEPFQSPVFERLCAFADRVVIDSATFTQPAHDDMNAMAELLAHNHVVSDFVWGRLTSWRELTAQFFDMAAMQPLLDQISRVTIEYAAQPSAPMRESSALLLLGWLASRLEWIPAGSVQAEGVTTITLRHRNGQTIEATLRATDVSGADVGMLTAMVLETPRARFSITRKGASDWAIVQSQIHGRRPLQHGVRLEQPSEAELLGEELRLLKHDQNYKAAFRLGVQMLR